MFARTFLKFESVGKNDYLMEREKEFISTAKLAFYIGVETREKK